MMIHQWRLMWASTPLAWTTDAMGRTMIAEMQSLYRPREDLGHRHQPDRAGRLHPVLDLAGESELLGHDQGHRLHALEEDGDPHHAGDQQRGEGRLGHRAAPAADALADLREDVEEDEAEQERLDEHPDHELDQVLAQHHQVAEDQRPQRSPAGVEGRRGSGSTRPWRPAGAPRPRSSVPQLLAGEVDEDRLERGLGHRQVDAPGTRPPPARRHHRGQQPVLALHVELRRRPRSDGSG